MHLSSLVPAPRALYTAASYYCSWPTPPHTSFLKPPHPKPPLWPTPSQYLRFYICSSRAPHILPTAASYLLQLPPRPQHICTLLCSSPFQHFKILFIIRQLIIFVLFFFFQVQTANNLLLLHLGIVDSLLCVIFLVFSAPEMLKGWAWLGLGAPCNLHGFLFTLLHPVALWTVCGLNCDRYYAITSPLHYGAMVSPKKVNT